MILFEKVAVLGGGLLGASFAAAMRGRGLCSSVNVWSRSASTREKCARQPWCSAVFDTPAAAVKAADLVVLCATVGAIRQVAKEIAPHVKKGAIITDVGSAKGGICAFCEKVFKGTGAVFVGSHPMAGSEKSGPDFASAELFNGRACFVCPPEKKNDAAVAKVKKTWEALGMKVGLVDAARHDAIVARVSHLPHILAVMLCVNASKYRDARSLKKFASSGFKDTTRIAASSSGLWREIFEDNRVEILKSLKTFVRDLGEVADIIEAEDFDALEKILQTGKTFREALK